MDRWTSIKPWEVDWESGSIGGFWFPAVLREGSKAISWKTNGAVLAWGRWIVWNINLLTVFKSGSFDICLTMYLSRICINFNQYLFSHSFRPMFCPGNTSRSWCTWYWQPGVATFNPCDSCWWFRNPVNSPVELLVVFTIIYRGLYIPGGCLGFLPSTV